MTARVPFSTSASRVRREEKLIITNYELRIIISMRVVSGEKSGSAVERRA